MSPEALIGVELGNSVIQRLLGQGTMGAVYLAVQGDRQVAVKVFLPASPLEEAEKTVFQQRLGELIKRGAALEHAHILPVLSYGMHEQLVYQVTPYIAGTNLEALFARKQPWPFTHIQQYLDQLAAALDYAHAHGVLHGDIKASNILISSTGDLLIGDFCLASLTLEKNFAGTRRALSGMLNSIAPEYVLGQKADPRADLYSLGALLYQMVTGVPPFTGTSLSEVAMKHVKQAPPAPSSLRTDLPHAAEQTMLRALAKQPSDRYAHARDLASAFRLALAASPPTPAEETPSQAFQLRADFAGDGQTNEEQTLSPRTGGLFDPKWRAQTAPNPTISATLAESAVATLNAEKTALPEEFAFVAPAPIQESEEVLSSSSFAASPMDLPPEEQPTNPVPQVHAEADSAAQPNQSAGQPFSPIAQAQSTPAEETTLSGMASGGRSPGLLSQAGLRNRLAEQTSLYEVGQPGLYTSSNTLQMAFEAPASTTEAFQNLGMQQAQASSPTEMLGELAKMPLNNDGTGTVKLTESVKIVQFPIAGQPGRFMTGYLPSQPAEPPVPPEHQQRSNKMKIVSLVLAALIVLAGSGVFLTLRNHNSQTSNNAQTHVTPNVQASAFAQATATANSNIILSDDLSQNSNQWPTGTQNGYTCTFTKGAYHITNHDNVKSASILLPGKPLNGPFTYSLTMEQIKGDQTSSSNLFGMILYATVKNSPGKAQVDTFYAFEIQNTSGGQYQFWKYDNGKDASSPWSQLWTKDLGKEFKQGSGPTHINTVKIVATGKMFTFIVNNKQVGTWKDHSFSSGTVGMLVNLDGAEVAFSRLVLARS